MVFLILIGIIEFQLIYSWLSPFLSDAPLFFWIGVIALQILIASQIWLYFLFFRAGPEVKIHFESFLRNFAFYSMGVISFLFSFTLIRDTAGLLILPFGVAKILYGTLASKLIFGISSLSFVIGLWNAKFRVLSPRIVIPIQDFPLSLKGLKIVQLSDMHLGSGPNFREIRKLVDQALALKPDLIVLTGDIFDGEMKNITLELKELSRLQAPHGVYFVLGNHECYWDWQACIAQAKDFGFIPLLNEGKVLKIKDSSIYIAGLTDPAITHVKGEAPRIPNPPETSCFNLLLVHQPQFAKKVSEFNYHLQLSGHTHGGQFFPWNIAVKKMYANSGGLGKEKSLWVYVSHGSGYWGPPLRLGTAGEVTELLIE